MLQRVNFDRAKGDNTLPLSSAAGDSAARTHVLLSATQSFPFYNVRLQLTDSVNSSYRTTRYCLHHHQRLCPRRQRLLRPSFLHWQNSSPKGGLVQQVPRHGPCNPRQVRICLLLERHFWLQLLLQHQTSNSATSSLQEEQLLYLGWDSVSAAASGY